METRADRARLALLITLQVATKDFTDQGAVAVLRWYEEFCASEGNYTEPLDLSSMDLKILPDFVPLPLSFGVPYVKLTDNPDLEDITAIQEMPIVTKFWTISHIIKNENSQDIVRVLSGIRKEILKNSGTLEIYLEGAKNIPIYIQLLPHIEKLYLDGCYEIKDLEILDSFDSIKHLTISCFYNPLSLKTLKKSTNIGTLEIRGYGYEKILDDIGSIPSLEEVVISDGPLRNLEALNKLPNLVKLELDGYNYITELHINNKLLFLKKLVLSHTPSLKTICIDESCPSLTSIKIFCTEKLKEIHGLHHLNNLKKLKIMEAKRLIKLQGIERATSLKDIELTNFKIGFIKTNLKRQISSKRYQTLKRTWIHTPFSRRVYSKIDIARDKSLPDTAIDVRILEHQLAAMLPITAFSTNSGESANTGKVSLLSKLPSIGLGSLARLFHHSR